MTKAVGAFYVRTKNLDQSVEFYSKTLGVTFKRLSPQVARVELENVAIVIEQAEFSGLTPIISFAVDNLDAAIQQATGLGAKIHQSKQPGVSGDNAVLADPDGNPVELVHLKS